MPHRLVVYYIWNPLSILLSSVFLCCAHSCVSGSLWISADDMAVLLAVAASALPLLLGRLLLKHSAVFPGHVRSDIAWCLVFPPALCWLGLSVFCIASCFRFARVPTLSFKAIEAGADLLHQAAPGHSTTFGATAAFALFSNNVSPPFSSPTTRFKSPSPSMSTNRGAQYFSTATPWKGFALPTLPTNSGRAGKPTFS